MSVKSERKKTVKTQKQTETVNGFVVRKKYPLSEEWFYFANETDFGYLWTPESALKLKGGFGVAVFPTKKDANRMAKRIEKYHEERRQHGKASGSDVFVADFHAVYTPDAAA